MWLIVKFGSSQIFWRKIVNIVPVTGLEQCWAHWVFAINTTLFPVSAVGGGKVISKSHTVSARIRETSQKTIPSTTQRIRNQTSGDACSFTRNQTNHQENVSQDPSKPCLVFCPVCRIATRDARQLEVHLRSHTGEKPFKCSICEKSFSQIQNRDRHERTHTGARPFHCRFCNKTFTQNHHRKKHEAKSHGGLWNVLTTEVDCFATFEDLEFEVVNVKAVKNYCVIPDLKVEAFMLIFLLNIVCNNIKYRDFVVPYVCLTKLISVDS